MKIADFYYIGVNHQKENLSFQVPHPFNLKLKKDKDAWENRKKSVNSWLYDNKYGGEKNTNYTIHEKVENVPLKGFKIVERQRRLTTENVVWRIEDPRGFLFEISSENFSELISNVTMKKGLIDKPCIWLKNGSRTYLAIKDSQHHKNAIKETDFDNNPAKTLAWNDVKIGNKVKLNNGLSVYFMGGYYPFGLHDGDAVLRSRNYFVKHTGKIYKCSANCKPVEIIDKSEKEYPDIIDDSYQGMNHKGITNTNDSTFFIIRNNKEITSNTIKFEDVKSVQEEGWYRYFNFQGMIMLGLKSEYYEGYEIIYKFFSSNTIRKEFPTRYRLSYCHGEEYNVVTSEVFSRPYLETQSGKLYLKLF